MRDPYFLAKTVLGDEINVAPHRTSLDDLSGVGVVTQIDEHGVVLALGGTEVHFTSLAWSGDDARLSRRDPCPLCGEDRNHYTQTIRGGHRC